MSERLQASSSGACSAGWSRTIGNRCRAWGRVREIRIHTGAEHRVLYVAKFAEAVYVLHAFEKRTRRTPQDVLDLARHRLRLLLNQRARQKG